MRSVRALIAALGLALICAGSAQAQSISGEASRVIARAEAAAGGARGWNRLAGVHETGTQDGAKYQRWTDPLRWGLRIETQEANGARIQGFNGAAEWQRAPPDGRLTDSNAAPAMTRARTETYFASHGFFFPSRFGADITYLGARQAGGKSYEVLRIHPLGGEAREAWFDSRTGLLGRLVDRTGAQPITTELSDYRRVSGLMFPFKQVSDRGGRQQVRTLSSVVAGPVDRGLFSSGPAQGR